MDTAFQSCFPQLRQLSVTWQNRDYSIPYFYRAGSGGPSIAFVHGLGGAKENFYFALQSSALACCTLLMFDNPGTGLAPYYPDAGLNVSALADVSQSVIDALMPEKYYLAGASMGGLITLLQIRRHGLERIEGLINFEGNLCPEDCMFSRRVIPHSLKAFEQDVFGKMAAELRASPYAGDQMIAHNMLLNTDVRAYHAYSFETVAESDSGRLIEEFIGFPLRKLFLYGEANKGLSYLPRLRASGIDVREVPSAAHFLFYDNPEYTFKAIADFVQ